jgi:hypothetical protein
VTTDVVQAVRLGRRRRWHVVVDGRAACGARPETATPPPGVVPAAGVVWRERCQRRGCQDRWPDTQETTDERIVECDRCRRERPISQLEHEVDYGFGPGCTEHNYWCKDEAACRAATDRRDGERSLDVGNHITVNMQWHKNRGMMFE